MDSGHRTPDPTVQTSWSKPFDHREVQERSNFQMSLKYPALFTCRRRSSEELPALGSSEGRLLPVRSLLPASAAHGARMHIRNAALAILPLAPATAMPAPGNYQPRSALCFVSARVLTCASLRCGRNHQRARCSSTPRRSSGGRLLPGRDHRG